VYEEISIWHPSLLENYGRMNVLEGINFLHYSLKDKIDIIFIIVSVASIENFGKYVTQWSMLKGFLETFD
jgi:hypothetical protein